MGRRSRKNKNKNKYKNKRNSVKSDVMPANISNSVAVLRFLKRDSDVGLFVDDDGKKFRVHKGYIYATLGWIPKGTWVSVKAEYAIHVKNRRLVATNTPEWFGNKEDGVDFDELAREASTPKTKKEYMYDGTINVIETNHDSSYFGLPIGTQYHWLAFKECPEEGDFVMASKTTGAIGGVIGYVQDIYEKSGKCLVNDEIVDIYDIAYKIINPEFLKSFEFANA